MFQYYVAKKECISSNFNANCEMRNALFANIDFFRFLDASEVFSTPRGLDCKSMAVLLCSSK